MKYSKLFPKTLRKPPSGEESANAKLLEQAGFIRKHMAGVYNYLPLGLRVLEKIGQVIREEMNSIGGQELQMASLQPRQLWEKTGRWKILGKDVMYQFKDMGLAITHEEVFTQVAAGMISSYKDLPLFLYQIQTKFRNEARPRFGLVRGREFLMKDLYTFDISDEAHQASYEKVSDAYLKAFKRVCLDVLVVEASGGVFSKEFSHEFQVLTPSGEDEVIHCKSCDFAQNREICDLKKGDKCPRCGEPVEVSNGIEVGNIFHLGTKFSEPLGLLISDEKGQKSPAVMGSYGWGPSRVMGTLVEVFHDEKGIIWPESVAPFMVHIVGLDLEAESAKGEAERVEKLLEAEGVEVLFDDRVDVSAGAKFADADLIGIPYRVIISKKTGEKLEAKKRSEKQTAFMSFEEFLKQIRLKNP